MKALPEMGAEASKRAPDYSRVTLHLDKSEEQSDGLRRLTLDVESQVQAGDR